MGAEIQLIRSGNGETDTVIPLDGGRFWYVDTLVPEKLYVYLLRYRITTDSWSPTAQATVRLPLPLPPAPTALASTNFDAGNVSLTWTPPADFPPTLSQRIDRVVAGRWVRVGIVEPSVGAFMDSPLNANSLYLHRVCAVNGYGESCTDTKAIHTGAVETGAPTLGKPSPLADRVTLSLTSASVGASGYIGQRFDANTWIDASPIADSTSMSVTIEGLAPARPYLVRACALFTDAAGRRRACAPALFVTTSAN
jgi:hypothetical protein